MVWLSCLALFLRSWSVRNPAGCFVSLCWAVEIVRKGGTDSVCLDLVCASALSGVVGGWCKLLDSSRNLVLMSSAC